MIYDSIQVEFLFSILFMDWVSRRAYAKINIGLNIISQRDDGYHNIETVFQQIDLFDQIVVKRIPELSIVIRCNDNRVPTNHHNLCYKAVKLIHEHTAIKEGVEIRIHKRIPLGAGLGGGSSDAAATIAGLKKLWRFQITPIELQRLALRLGADVPYFLHGGTALASGVGENLSSLSLPFKFYCVLIYPNIEICSTWAYKNFNFVLTKTKKCIKLSQIFSQQLPIGELKRVISNDLEEVVFQKYPVLRQVKKLLYSHGAFFAGMSGSGSTIYGLFKNYLEAVVVMRSIPKPYQIILAKPMITKNHL
jgi:4-diphosphocytidyl-2-C-methyl-D-erythritol kinase